MMLVKFLRISLLVLLGTMLWNCAQKSQSTTPPVEDAAGTTGTTEGAADDWEGSDTTDGDMGGDESGTEEGGFEEPADFGDENYEE